jgi:RNA polymerase sigma-70 factor (ECF subfamily)
MTAVKPLMVDYSAARDIDMPAVNSSTNGHETRQSIEEFRGELLTMAPQLRAFARMLSSDKHSAEELSLKTLAEAWRNRFAVGRKTNLKAWLFTIARNTFYSNRYQELSKAPFQQTVARGNPSHGEDSFWSADISGTRRALRFLPDQFREALILVCASGCSYKEAAKICDCPVGTVKSRVFRARQALVANFDTTSVV